MSAPHPENLTYFRSSIPAIKTNPVLILKLRITLPGRKTFLGGYVISKTCFCLATTLREPSGGISRLVRVEQRFCKRKV